MNPELVAEGAAVLLFRLVEMSPRFKRFFDRLDAEGKIAVVVAVCFALPFLPALVAAAYGVDPAEVLTRAEVVRNLGFGLLGALIATGAHDVGKLLKALPVRAR